MKNIIFLVVILMVGCNSILANNWKIKENSDLKHIGIDVIYLENDNARIMLADKNGKLNAVSINIESGERIGINYKEQTNSIDYIKLPSKKDTLIKLFRTAEGNWKLIEYSDYSEKVILNSVELN